MLSTDNDVPGCRRAGGSVNNSDGIPHRRGPRTVVSSTAVYPYHSVPVRFYIYSAHDLALSWRGLAIEKGNQLTVCTAELSQAGPHRYRTQLYYSTDMRQARRCTMRHNVSRLKGLIKAQNQPANTASGS